VRLARDRAVRTSTARATLLVAGWRGHGALEAGLVSAVTKLMGSLNDLSTSLRGVLIKRRHRVGTLSSSLSTFDVLGRVNGKSHRTVGMAMGVSVLCHQHRRRLSSPCVPTVEEEQSDDVTKQTERSDNGDDHSIADLWRADESTERFETDGKTKRQEEYTVDERTENLSSLPSVRVGRG